MQFRTAFTLTLAALFLGLLPAAAPAYDHGPRKWSRPSYDAKETPPSTAPKLGDFIGDSMDNDAALFDGDGRPLKFRRDRTR